MATYSRLDDARACSWRTTCWPGTVPRPRVKPWPWQRGRRVRYASLAATCIASDSEDASAASTLVASRRYRNAVRRQNYSPGTRRGGRGRARPYTGVPAQSTPAYRWQDSPPRPSRHPCFRNASLTDLSIRVQELMLDRLASIPRPQVGRDISDNRWPTRNLFLSPALSLVARDLCDS